MIGCPQHKICTVSDNQPCKDPDYFKMPLREYYDVTNVEMFFFCGRSNTIFAGDCQQRTKYLSLPLLAFILLYLLLQGAGEDVKIGTTHIDSMFPCIFKAQLIKTLINILQIRFKRCGRRPVRL